MHALKESRILPTKARRFPLQKRVLLVMALLALAVSGCNFQKMEGGSGDDGANSIQQTRDGGYIVAGLSFSTDIPGVTNHGSADYYLLKLNAKGAVVWQKMYGGSGIDFAYSIQQTRDGGYIVAGHSSSTDIPGVTIHGINDCYLLKLDANGAVVWQKMYGGSGDDFAYSIQQTRDGGYIVAGYSSSTNKDYYLLKLDATGAVVWQKMYGGSFDDVAYSIQQTLDNGYIVAGYATSTNIPGVTNHGGSDYYLLKLDVNGAMVWQKMYGGSGDDEAYSIQQTSDGGYIVAGLSTSTDIPKVFNHGGEDYYLLKLDANGNL